MFKEGSEPDIYRDNLAEEIKQASKEERKEILEQAKETPEYQVARNKKIEGRQNEEEIDDGLGVFIKHKTLYHGSVTQGIKEFKESGDVTVGNGVYLTSKAKDAFGYAHQRQMTGNEQLIMYEASIQNLKLLDIRNDENLKRILPEYKTILEAEDKKMIEMLLDDSKRGELPYWYPGSRREFVKRALKSINSEETKVSTIQDVTLNISDLFTDYVKSLGYDGLITIEGGEGNHKGNHDSYVIFDPEKVKISKEQKIKKEAKKAA